MLRLIPGRTPVGAGQHRAGWPYAVQSLRPLLHPNGVLLDDFVEQTYLYAGSVPDPRECPWIGIFHHPQAVTSPLESDQREQLRSLRESRSWRDAAPYLRAAIALSTSLRDYLEQELQLPTLAVKHPTEVPDLQWSPDYFFAQMPLRVLQTGHYLRNTRVIFQLPPVKDFLRTRLLCQFPWVKDRERQLREVNSHQDIEPEGVVEMAYVDNTRFDQLLASSVLLMESYGASASNVVIECIARNTPLLVNRLPAIVEYLGEDYPLYFDNLEHAAALLTERKLREAYAYLQQLDKSWLSGEAFAADLSHFVKQLDGLRFVAENLPSRPKPRPVTPAAPAPRSSPQARIRTRLTDVL